MITKIVGTGSCLPESVVTNEDLSKIMDTTDEWIVSRTGIRERRLVKEETTASMSVKASQRALEDAGVEPEEIDLILVATITGDYVTPSTACEIQAGLGAVNAVAFDINAACSGFMFALHTAHAYLQMGTYRTALILGAETLSKIMDWTDRSTCVLFGDGAGAAVVRAFDETRRETRGETHRESCRETCGEKEGSGLLAFEQGSDGERGKALICPARANNNPLVSNPYMPGYVYMDGQDVYKFAVSTVPASIERILKKAELEEKDIKYFMLHQANIRIIQSVCRRLKSDMEKFPLSLDHCGNISAASVPILLDEMNKKGMLQSGDRIVLSGFGAGLTWASAVLEW